MPFEDIVVAGYAAAAQTLPLAPDERPKSTLGLVNEAIGGAVDMAGVDRRRIDAVITHRPPSADHVLQFNQKIVEELKIAPTSTTSITNHGAGMLSGFKYGALLLERGLADYVLLASGDAGALWIHDEAGQNANLESDTHFEAPYKPITPALYAQVGQRYLYERKIGEEALAHIAVENRKWALRHPDATMRHKGELTKQQVLESPMIASPSRLLHCAPFYKGGRAGAVVLARAADVPWTGRPAILVRSVGECVTHEYISGRMGLYGFGPWADGPNLTVTAAALAARQAYEFGEISAADLDIVNTPLPFAFAILMVLEELELCPPGQVADWVLGGGIDFDGGLPFNTHGGSLSFGQSHLNCIMDCVIESLEQLDGVAKGRQVEDPRTALVHSHGGVLAAHTVAIFERSA
ncbi:thiolase family protein [Actinophytocola sp.]|uniref:thiolase family protein n=1 Tax=Actinophytocola sp. TaxID=1872138 RepID=UPI003D6A084C